MAAGIEQGRDAREARLERHAMSPAQTVRAPAANETTLAQSRDLIGILRQAPEKQALIWLAGLIVAVIVLNALAQLWLNRWQGTFYDAIAQRDLRLFYWNLGVFVAIAGVLLVLGVAQTWLHKNLKIKLREAVTFDLIDEWLRPKRAYRLPLMSEIGTHPDQRIQDDARRLVELSVDLGVGLVQSTLLLASFVGVLWMLSAQVVFSVGETRFAIPGYMVWCALAYALIGSYVTWLVGKPLIRANAELRAREADFRFLLVRVDAAAEAVAIPAASRTNAAAFARWRPTLSPSCARSRRPREADLDHRRLWLARDRRADRRGGAGLFPGRPDDDRRRVHPGPAIAALVRGSLSRPRGMAGNAASRRHIPGCPGPPGDDRGQPGADRLLRSPRGQTGSGRSSRLRSESSQANSSGVAWVSPMISPRPSDRTVLAIASVSVAATMPAMRRPPAAGRAR
jgi:hypothetical protein